MGCIEPKKENFYNFFNARKVQDALKGEMDLDYCIISQGSPPLGPMLMTVKTDNPGSSNNDQFTWKQLSGQSPNFTITVLDDIGQTLTITSDLDPMTLTFSSPGTYNLSIDGDDIVPSYGFNQGDIDKMTNLSQWGKGMLGDEAFNGATNMTITATDQPSELRPAGNSLSACFGNMPLLNWAGAGDLDFNGLTPSLQNFFANASIFNQPINWINSQNIISYDGVFLNCLALDQDLSGLDFTGITDINGLRNFVTNTNLSSTNYNALLAKLRSDAEGAGILSGLTLGANGLVATGQGVTDRTWLINNTSMTIIDAT